MNEPIVFKRSASVALMASAKAAAPAVIAVGMLALVARLNGVPFAGDFLLMGLLVAVLAPIVVQLPDPPSEQLFTAQWPTALGLLVRWGLLLAILLAIGYAAKISGDFSRRIVLTWAVTTPVVLIFTVVVLNELMRRYLSRPENVRRALFAGYNEASLALDERLRQHQELGVSVDGFFDDRSPERLGARGESRLLGGLTDIAEYVKTHRVDVIFMALPMRHVQRVLRLLDELHDTTASIYYVPDVFVFDLIQSRSGQILGIPVVAMCETPFHGYRGIIKRTMDVSFSLIALILLLPLLLVVAVLIRLDSPGPVIFKQHRYGLDGRLINVYKFRTMKVTENGAVIRQATQDDERITKVGRVLRRYSIDELPQLVNVLQGRMSLVGPRPHAVAHNEQYRRLIKGYMIRHKVAPGLTGLAQVNGCRGETARLEDMKRRIEYDLDYLRGWTPMLDLKIMWRTALILLHDRKAY